MLIIHLQGGLGNQMFQYAYGESLANRYNLPLGLDVSFLEKKPSNPSYTLRDFRLDMFNLDRLIVDSKATDFLQSRWGKISHRISQHLIKRDRQPISSIVLKGYWQSEHFFNSISTEIKQTFTFPKPQNKTVLLLEADIQKQEHAVSVHIRRGDYVENAVHNVCTQGYYENAIDTIKSALPSAKVYIFSDDIPYCKEIFGDDVCYIEGLQDYEDLYLMTQCKHNIISNSSFSWWGAWLGEKSDSYIIAPDRWFNDEKLNKEFMDDFKIIPDRWQKIII